MRTAFAVFCLVLALGLGGLMGCGGGGDDGGGPNVTPPGQDLRGTYRLFWFIAELYDEATCSNPPVTLTQNDYANWSGSMTISDTTITQDYVLNGTLSVSSGNYTITYTGDSTGVFHVVDGFGSHDVGFSTAGNQLITDTGCVDLLGLGIREVDTWEKTSDHAARRRAQIARVSGLPLGGAAGTSAVGRQ